MTGPQCPICQVVDGHCGHLLARFELDAMSEIDSGALVADGGIALDQLRTIAVESLRTGEYVFLGDAFSSVLDQARNSDPDDDPEASIDELMPQISYALIEMLDENPSVHVLSEEAEITCWAPDPASVVANLKVENESLIEQLKALADRVDEEDEDESDG